VGPGSGDLATAVGNVMGTPAYMSPEQARGEDLDARADVYSLGALLYELLVGEPPHTGPSVQDVLASAQRGDVVPIDEREPAAPSDLRAIVRKAMATDRADRYASAVEMAADLRRFQTGQLVTARHYSTPALVWRWVGRHRAIVAVALAAAVALAGTGVWSFRRVMAQRNRAETQMHIAESRRDELIFRQAQNLLERDPTAALAYLKSYPVDGDQAMQLGGMVDDAVAAGVARHVLRHDAWVMRLAFTSDGRLVTTDADGNLSIWDVTTGKRRQVLHHHGDVQGELSPDGSTLVLARPDGRVEIQPTDGGPARPLRGLDARDAVHVAFDADGRRALGIANRRARVWDTATGAVVIATDDEPGLAGTLSADGARAYVARESGEVVEWREGGGARPRTVARFAEPVMWLKVSPDGKQLLVQDAAGWLALVDVASGKRQPLGRHVVNFDGTAVWSHAGDRVAVTPDDSTILLYHLPDGEETTLRGHSDPVYDIAFARDDSFLYSSSDDGTARIWNLVTGETQVLRGHGDDVARLALSPDGKWLATASFDSSVRVWPLAAAAARVMPGRIIDAEGIEFVAGGARLLVGNRDGEGESFDLATGASIRFQLERSKSGGAPALGKNLLIAADARGGASLYDVTSGDERPLPRENTRPVVAVGISSDDARAVTIDESGALLLWDVATEKARSVSLASTPHRVRFLPGRREVLLAAAGRLELWDLEHDRAVMRAELPGAQSSYAPRDITISRDGRMIAAWRAEGPVLLWNTADNRVSVLDADQIQSVAIAPGGARVAFGLGTRVVDVWDAASGNIGTAIHHGDFVHQVAFSPDGKILASCSFDRTVRLWTGAGQPVRVLRGHGADVKAIAFSADGKTLASVGGDGTVRLWPVTALPDARPAATPARLAAATTAVVDGEGHVFTPSE
jgi:WD40 repeat protein